MAWLLRLSTILFYHDLLLEDHANALNRNAAGTAGPRVTCCGSAQLAALGSKSSHHGSVFKAAVSSDSVHQEPCTYICGYVNLGG